MKKDCVISLLEAIILEISNFSETNKGAVRIKNNIEYRIHMFKKIKSKFKHSVKIKLEK